VYTQLLRKKVLIYLKTRLGKGERMKTQTQSEQELSSNDTTRAIIDDINIRRKVLQTLRNKIHLQCGCQFCYEETLSMARVNHNRWK
jgi:hypothetical protein